MGHSSPSTQSILSPFHCNGSTASAVSQIGSPSFNLKNGNELSFASRSPVSENKSAATFAAMSSTIQTEKTFAAIKMATMSPWNAAAATAMLKKQNNALSSVDTTTQSRFSFSNRCNTSSPSYDPFCTPTKSQSHRAIHSLSTINAASVRRQPTSNSPPKLSVSSSAPSALDRHIAVGAAATIVTTSPSSGYTTPKCFAPLACLSFNASICGRGESSIDARIVSHYYYERIQMAPSRKKVMRNSDAHLSTPHRPVQPSRARLSLLSKFQMGQDCGHDERWMSDAKKS